MLEILISLTISFFIGLFLGIERERSHPEGVQAFGVRTFILFSILGTMAATINQPLMTISLSLFVFGIILLSYFRSTEKSKRYIDIGITTEVAAGIVFALGYMIPYFPFIAITIGAVVLLVLMERKQLHVFSREKLKQQEIEAFIILIIFGLGVLPILPNHPIDPWQLFNPRNFGILITVIAGMQFSGYIAIRLFGQNAGRLIIGFLGGLVSSTAVFATLRDTLESKRLIWVTMASAIFAILAVIVEFAIILLVASPTLLAYVAWPLIIMVIVSGIIATFLFNFKKIKNHPPSKIVVPLKFSSILYSSMLIAIILLFIAITKRYIGTKGLMLVSFLGGFFELHGVTLATALLYIGNQLKISDAGSMLAVAFLASFVSKFILLWALTPRYFAFWLSIFLLIILASGGASYLLIINN